MPRHLLAKMYSELIRERNNNVALVNRPNQKGVKDAAVILAGGLDCGVKTIHPMECTRHYETNNP